MSFGLKSKNLSKASSKSTGDIVKRQMTPVVGYEIFSGESSDEDDDFEEFLEGGKDRKIGMVKLVFKVRLFLNYAIHKIDPLGIINMNNAKHKSNFRRLLFFQIEKCISDEKWPLEQEKVRARESRSN